MNVARMPRSASKSVIGFIAALLVACAFSPATAQPGTPASSSPRSVDSDPAKPKRAWRISISGDLVCSSLAQRLSDEFVRIKAAHAEAVILQISAGQWRGDIALQLAQTIRDANLPVHVVLKPGPSGRIGIGSLIIGLGATSLWMTPNANILGSAADQVATPSLTAKEIKAETAALTELIDAGLSRRAAPLEIGPLLLAPAAPRWLLTSKGASPRISDEGSPDASAIPIITLENEGAILRFTDLDALNARLIDGIRGGDSLFKFQGFLHARPKAEPAVRDEFTFTADSTLSCDLDAEYKEVCTTLASIDDAIDRAQKLLDPPGSAKPSSTARSMAERSLSETRLALDSLETRLKSTPELAQRPVPGQSEVGVKSSGWPSKWRSALQKRRDQVTRLTAKTK